MTKKKKPITTYYAFYKKPVFVYIIYALVHIIRIRMDYYLTDTSTHAESTGQILFSRQRIYSKLLYLTCIFSWQLKFFIRVHYHRYLHTCNLYEYSYNTYSKTVIFISTVGLLLTIFLFYQYYI